MALPPQGPPESVTLQQFLGVKNTVAPERLKPGELEAAVNVDIDDEGQPRRRRGYTQVDAEPHHSLFTASWGTLGVRSGVLGRIEPGYSFTPITAGVGDAPVAFLETAQFVFYSSVAASGKIRSDLTVEPWGNADGPTWLSPVVNPTATLSPIAGRLLGSPPTATAMVESGGRIYLAHENLIWATEMFAYDYVDRTRSFMQFEDRITGMGSVQDGFYVGTEAKTYFLTGSLGQMRRVEVNPEGTLDGSMIDVAADLVRPESSVSRGAVLFMTKRGLCVGLDSGICYNMTQSRVTFPQAERVAAMLRQQDGMAHYVGVTDSRGAPTSNARIGDYVDAEIRRHQGA